MAKKSLNIWATFEQKSPILVTLFMSSTPTYLVRYNRSLKIGNKMVLARAKGRKEATPILIDFTLDIKIERKLIRNREGGSIMIKKPFTVVTF